MRMLLFQHDSPSYFAVQCSYEYNILTFTFQKQGVKTAAKGREDWIWLVEEEGLREEEGSVGGLVVLSHLLLHLSGRPGWFRKVKTWTTSPLALRPTCRPGQLASRWVRRPGLTWTAPSGTRPPSQVWDNCNFAPF